MELILTISHVENHNRYYIFPIYCFTFTVSVDIKQFSLNYCYDFLNSAMGGLLLQWASLSPKLTLSPFTSS